MRLPTLTGILLTALLSAVAGAGEASKLQVVTTTGMVKDLVQQVGGDRITVDAIMSEGVDPHLYQPTATDVRKVLAADLVFASGLNLEGRMTEVFEQSDAMGKKVVFVTDGVNEELFIESADYPGQPDPHVWHDVTQWATGIPVVVEALTKADPEGASVYEANAARYADRLNGLNGYVTWVMSSVPQKQRVLITAHDAFGYFGQAYGIEVRGVQGISTESEAGIKDINELVDFIVENGITAVFIEASVNDRNVQALVEGARERGQEVTIGGTLYSDSMGAPGTWEGTYEGMIEHNVNLMSTALGGSAPENGYRGAASLDAEGS
ncbi:MAG TPA: manganese transporter [Phycisphaerales bacterium]|nr:manganese transporter [Phycisphaerales bacterium]